MPESIPEVYGSFETILRPAKPRAAEEPGVNTAWAAKAAQTQHQ